MDIEILEMTDRKARFILRNSSPAMANALRRTLIADLPKLAIDSVDFHLGILSDEEGREHESNTPLFNEVIAHRLGMLPLPTDLNLFVPQDQCSCEGAGCPSCSITYSLNKSGPCTVYSRDLMPLGNQDLAVIDGDIPIVELTDGQAIMIYATAVLGTAAKHVKWQVCSGVGYSYLPKITIDKSHAKSDDMLEVADVCPKKVLVVDGGKLAVDESKIYSCNLCRACTEKLGEGKGLTVEGDDTSFVFQFETDGSYKAEAALKKAIEILSEEATAFKKEIEALS